MQHIVTRWGWTQLIIFCFMITGTRCLVTVDQPPLLTAALGDNVSLPCFIHLSPDETMVILPVLYWEYYKNRTSKNFYKLWIPSEEYTGRVDLADKGRNTSDKSVVLRDVRWEDSGTYLCKLSITTRRGSFRSRGNKTLLNVYDTMAFNATAHNGSLLSCEVNVTYDPRLVLSISLNGYPLRPNDSSRVNAKEAHPFVTLSETVPLSIHGEYVCELHLNRDLITKSVLHHPPPERGEFPEPWLLYVSLLLVPIVVLLSLLTALLVCRCCPTSG
ncbi:nectin-4-like isoform X2 [Pungitius pungitius]|uniref:nectin-4-like isoform X2 n=1 Tax=Pungitius pungitius TaxID=134920 RepID=UPI002E13022F